MPGGFENRPRLTRGSHTPTSPISSACALPPALLDNYAHQDSVVVQGTKCGAPQLLEPLWLHVPFSLRLCSPRRMYTTKKCRTVVLTTQTGVHMLRWMLVLTRCAIPTQAPPGTDRRLHYPRAAQVCVSKLPHGFSSDTGQGAWSDQFTGKPWYAAFSLALLAMQRSCLSSATRQVSDSASNHRHSFAGAFASGRTRTTSSKTRTCPLSVNPFLPRSAADAYAQRGSPRRIIPVAKLLNRSRSGSRGEVLAG